MLETAISGSTGSIFYDPIANTTATRPPQFRVMERARAYNEDMERSLICFTPGTVIATSKGLRAVEELRAGDKVVARDTGYKTLNWVGCQALTTQNLAACPAELCRILGDAV